MAVFDDSSKRSDSIVVQEKFLNTFGMGKQHTSWNGVLDTEIKEDRIFSAILQVTNGYVTL